MMNRNFSRRRQLGGFIGNLVRKNTSKAVGTAVDQGVTSLASNKGRISNVASGIIDDVLGNAITSLNKRQGNIVDMGNGMVDGLLVGTLNNVQNRKDNIQSATRAASDALITGALLGSKDAFLRPINIGKAAVMDKIQGLKRLGKKQKGGSKIDKTIHNVVNGMAYAAAIGENAFKLAKDIRNLRKKQVGYGKNNSVYTLMKKSRLTKQKGRGISYSDIPANVQNFQHLSKDVRNTVSQIIQRGYVA